MVALQVSDQVFEDVEVIAQTMSQFSHADHHFCWFE